MKADGGSAPEAAAPDASSGDPGHLLAEYGAVNSNFQKLTDIRFQLLGLLPITASVALLLEPASGVSGLAFGLLGMAATLALATYNARNNQLYNELVGRAAFLERKLGIHDGAFALRPGTWLSILGIPMEHGWPVTLVYRASLAAWVYITLSAGLELLASIGLTISWLTLWAGLGAVVFVVGGQLVVLWRRKKRQEEMRAAVLSAFQAYRGGSWLTQEDDEFWEQLRVTALTLAGVWARESAGRIDTKAGYYLSRIGKDSFYLPLDAGETSSGLALFLALLTDLPARWIEDVGTGRAGFSLKPKKEEKPKEKSWVEPARVKKLMKGHTPWRKTASGAGEVDALEDQGGGLQAAVGPRVAADLNELAEQGQQVP